MAGIAPGHFFFNDLFADKPSGLNEVITDLDQSII